MPDYKDAPKLNFSIFPNSFKKSDKHPTKTGKIEFTRKFLKEMVSQAKAGTGAGSEGMPILRVALWDRTSQNNQHYENAVLQIDQSAMPKEEEEDDGLPF
tara:strand:+ start:556 stop:855 length:300 start_codon:yes stop_codon:yes gene_type:complete